MADLDAARKTPDAPSKTETPPLSEAAFPATSPRSRLIPCHSRPRRILAMCSTPVPGIGQVILRRSLKGSLFFVLFWVTLNGSFLNFALDDRGELRTYAFLFLGLAGLIWLIAFTDLVATLVTHRSLKTEERNARFIAGAAHYLRGEYPEAASLLSRLLNRNPRDTPVGIQLAHVYRHQGKPGKAKRLLRRCHRLDRTRQWEFEILSALRKIDHEGSD